VGRAFKPAPRDCVLVSLLKHMGAIMVAKSNLPQSIMVRRAICRHRSVSLRKQRLIKHVQWCETDNPLWGLTVHPQNSDLTPGGSTGGEAALLSLRGTVVGWGTDIGGSIRIPAHMNGIYGLKPSVGRLNPSRCRVMC
jgi:Asp-tRNA(Asn)/Glu-tRNA(Gln) amidotransferase A subunit family amidase